MKALRNFNGVTALTEWAEVELRSICDLESGAPEYELALQFHSELLVLCRQYESSSAPQDLSPVVQRINELTGVALESARSQLFVANSADVRYDLRSLYADDVDYLEDIPLESPSGQDDVAPRSPHSGGPATHPWWVDLEAVISAALHLRTYDPAIQRTFHTVASIGRQATKCLSRSILEGGTDSEAALAAVTADFDAVASTVPPEAMTRLLQVDGEFAGDPSTEYLPYPRTLSANESTADLPQIALDYSAFGRRLRFPYTDVVRGASSEVGKTLAAWRQFEGAGIGLQVLAGWVRALGVGASVKTCAVCYRHVASRARCAEHATKTHETRAARLAKRALPLYTRKLRELAAADDVLQSPTFMRASQTPTFRQCALSHGILDEDVVRNLAELASYLAGFEKLLSPDQAADMQELFGAFLLQAKASTLLPPPRSDAEEKVRAALHGRLLALISVPGFFQAWFTGHVPRLYDSPVPRRRSYDSRHPMARQASIDLRVLRQHLLMQRAWDEAISEYRSNAMPDVEKLVAMREEGKSLAQIGKRFGLSYESIRTMLMRPTNNRVRNRLP